MLAWLSCCTPTQKIDPTENYSASLLAKMTAKKPALSAKQQQN